MRKNLISKLTNVTVLTMSLSAVSILTASNARAVVFKLGTITQPVVETGTILEITEGGLPASTVDYWEFNLDQTEAIEVNLLSDLVFSEAIDPFIYLFEGTSQSLGHVVSISDDSEAARAFIDGSVEAGIVSATGDPITRTRDSYLSISLASGDYTVAVSRFDFTEADARDGVNNSQNAGTTTVSNPFQGDYQITIQAVPEPTSLITLLGLGALGFGLSKTKKNIDK